MPRAIPFAQGGELSPSHTKSGGGGVLIGAVALSFHVRPRMTQDMDFLFLEETDIPDAVTGFRRIRPIQFQRDRTGVEVKVAVMERSTAP